MKINMIRNNCLNCNLIGLRIIVSIRKIMRFLKTNADYGKLFLFDDRNLVVALVEMLLDVLVLVGDLGPHLDALLDAQDAAGRGPKAFVKAVVNGT